jgi:hypothetical protein
MYATTEQPTVLSLPLAAKYWDASSWAWSIESQLLGPGYAEEKETVSRIALTPIARWIFGFQIVPYQLAFWTPGIRPLPAMLRKQIRQIPNLR